jgi:hypothetical protein
MRPVYYVNDVTGLHPLPILSLKERSEVGMGLLLTAEEPIRQQLNTLAHST